MLSSINNTLYKKKAIILWNLTVDFQSDSDSFNPTLWEEQRQQRMTVAFEFEEKKEDDDNAGKVKVNFLAFVSPSISLLFLFVHGYYSNRFGDKLSDLGCKVKHIFKSDGRTSHHSRLVVWE
jgi:hypothetical protein